YTVLIRIRPAPNITLFPYTSLFRSPLLTESGPAKLQKTDIFRKLMWFSLNNDNDWHSITCERVREIQSLNEQGIKVFNLQVDKRSEEHTSELQSRENLVCRLLLEKK